MLSSAPQAKADSSQSAHTHQSTPNRRPAQCAVLRAVGDNLVHLEHPTANVDVYRSTPAGAPRARGGFAPDGQAPRPAITGGLHRLHQVDDALAGIRAKLDRANAHLESINGEVQAFRKRQPYRVEGQFDAQRGGYVFKLHIVERPPIAWGVLSGELVHNVRSALDNLVWELVLLNNQQPCRWNGYPIWDSGTKETFLRDIRRPRKGKRHPGKLHGVSDEACAVIERTQPYNGGLCQRLTALDALWNMDKHRFLMPTFMSITDPELIGPAYRANEDAKIVGEAVYLDAGWQKDGAELVFIPATATGPDPQVYMEGDLAIDVSFGVGGAMIDVLMGAIFFVLVDVLSPLSALFP